MRKKRYITLIRNGEEQIVFERVDSNLYREYYQKWEEDPESPEGAYGEWKTIHTTSFVPKETVEAFCAHAAAIGFKCFK